MMDAMRKSIICPGPTLSAGIVTAPREPIGVALRTIPLPFPVDHGTLKSPALFPVT